MNIGGLLEELRKREIDIFFSNGKLIYNGPEENITPKIIQKLKESKSELIKYFWPPECKNLTAINPEGTKPPIILIDFCTNAVINLSKFLGTDQPIYRFLQYDRSSTENLDHNSMGSLIQDYISQLKKVLPNGPYFLAADLAAGIIAYEMAVQLKRAGNIVPVLILLDSINFYSKNKFGFLNLLKLSLKKIIYAVFRALLLFKNTIIFRFINKNDMILRSLPRVRFYGYLPLKSDLNIVLLKTRGEIINHSPYYGWESLSDNIRVIDIIGDGETTLNDEYYFKFLGKELENYMAIH